MNSRSKRRSGFRWSAIVVVIAIALFGNHFRFFESVDGRVFDSFHRFALRPVDDSSVLLIECEPATLNGGNPELKTLLERIAQASPLAIGVVSERAPLFLENVALSSNKLGCPIVEGRNASQIDENERGLVGFSELSHHPQPVFRHAQLFASSKNRQLHSFERLLLAKAGFFADPGQSIGVRFGQSVHAIPRFSASRILDENYLPGLISNRIVIVGESMPESAGMLTPVSKHVRMPTLEVRGHIALTLLSNRPLQRAGFGTCLALLLLFSTCTFLVFRRLSHKHYLYVAISFCVVAVLCSFLAFRFLSTWLPITGLLFLAISIPACLWFDRFRTLHNIIATLRIRMTTSSLADSDPQGDDSWQKFESAANQFFGAARTAIFELETESQMLKLVQTSNCPNESEILEQRRDISRPPWQQAIDFGKAVKNSARPIFITTLPHDTNHAAGDFAQCNGDTEFIVPLLCGSKIFGFMVLEMNQADLRNWPDFENIVNEFASDFTQFVHRNRTLKIPERKWNNWNQTPESLDSRVIETQQVAIDKAVTQIEKAFESDSCCRMMFDAFGKAIKANSRMIRRLNSDTPVSEFVFTELLPMIADVEDTEVRVVFRNAIVSDQKTELETKTGSLYGNIVISPVAWEDESDSDRELTTRGILLEIFDSREKADLQKLKELLDETAGSQQSTHGSSLLTEIQELIDTARETVASRNEGTFETVWDAALFNSQPRFQKKNLSIATRLGDVRAVQVRDVDVVSNIVEVCLSVLAECSRHSDQLKVELQRNSTHWVLRMRNGQHDHNSNWSSPSILGKRQTELLFASRQKMQACGGSVDVEDTANGEVVIHVSFPAGHLLTENLLQESEAKNV